MSNVYMVTLHFSLFNHYWDTVALGNQPLAKLSRTSEDLINLSMSLDSNAQCSITQEPGLETASKLHVHKQIFAAITCMKTS